MMNEGTSGTSADEKSSLRRNLVLGPQNPVDKGGATTGALRERAAVHATRGADAAAGSSRNRPLTVRRAPRAGAGTSGAGAATLPPTSGHTRTSSSPLPPKPSGASLTLVQPRARPPSAEGAGSTRVVFSSGGGERFEHSFVPRGPKMHMTSKGEVDEGAARDATPIDPIQERIRKWYEIIQIFKKEPAESVEFVYLINADPGSLLYMPYNLEIVPHEKVRGGTSYFTISAKGVTHFWEGSGEFSSLLEFEHQFFLYSKLMKLKVFSLFRLRKMFKVWQRSVRSRKTHQVREVLGDQLFILNPVFRDTLLKIRSSCAELQNLKLHALHEGHLYTYDDLIQLHEDHQGVANAVLKDFSRSTVRTTQAACLSAMELMEETLLASKEKSPQAAKLAALAATSLHKAVTRAAQLTEDTEFGYAISAARRTEKRRIHNFVRLLDYMICHSLHQLLISSISDVLAALTPSPTTQPKSLSALSPRLPGLSPRLAVPFPPQDNLFLEVQGEPQWGGPLLMLEIFMEDEGEALAAAREDYGEGSDPGAEGGAEGVGQGQGEGEGAKESFATGEMVLVLEPPPELYIEHFAQAQLSYVELVNTISRLLADEKLDGFMERPVDTVDLDSFQDIIVGEEHRTRVMRVVESLHAAFTAVEVYKESFNEFRDLVKVNAEVTAERLQAQFESGERTLEDFRKDLIKYQDQLDRIKAIPPVCLLGVIEVHMAPFIAAFKPSPERCLEEIRSLLPKLAHNAYHAFITKVHVATSRLQSTPSSVEEFAGYLEFLSELEQNRRTYDEEMDLVTAHYDLMSEFKIKSSDMQQASYQTMENDYGTLRDAQWNADSNRDMTVALFKADLEQQVDVLNKEVVDIGLLASHDMIFDWSADIDTVTDFTAKLLAKVTAQQEQAERINKYQGLFKLPVTTFQDLDNCSEDVSLRHLLWTSRASWEETTDELRCKLLLQVEPAELEEVVMKMHKTVHKIERGLAVVPMLRDSVNTWREFYPVVQYLRNPNMKERHWGKVNEVLCMEIPRGESLTLQYLMDIRISDFKDAIMSISTDATQEAGLEAMLERIQDKWKSIEFSVNSYKDMKDTYTLGGIDVVMSVLEDSMVAITTILSSRYVGGIRSEVEKTERMLRLFSDTLDEWLECQRQWLYLETIFSAADIQRQLPAEAKAFAMVDKQYKDSMRRTKDRPNALVAGTFPGALEVFQKCNETLEVVQKNLEDYLETKRVSFPRFYFLSNDELLEILSQTRNAQAVQPHLQKCFDGIRSLDFGEDPKSIDIFAMVSAEGERVALGRNLKARGNVEGWLTNVELSMRTCIKALGRKGYKEYTSMERSKWILQNPAQLVIVVSNIFWCQSVEECFTTVEPVAALRLFYQQNLKQLGDLTALVGGELTTLERKVLVALITIDVHNRDIVDMLADSNVTSSDDFKWQMQLRYDYDLEMDMVTVRQVNAKFDYAYEYLGAQPRLVVTPMTDRCYLTLTGALHLKLGGAPAGPAGTGKTETTKDLGKALGVQCVVFNCGENLDYKFMGKFFSGLVQCGAWACFDEFNRIDIEVLSVVAQQLLAIQNALRAQLERFLFEGREIRLVPTCGVFITMNPGYAGRTELPDNLKALFRPMSMMIPDYALVAEVMLFSEGFSDARNLSRKMVQLYKLASEQLSQQDHYDFGMRALKSVLVMAGTLRRSNPQLSEDIVLIRAMRDSNIPKFLSEDARLFNAIVSDLFPGVKIPAQDYGVLQQAVEASCRDACLQPVPAFVTKVVQLYETFNVRFGVMLVGPTGGGKTECYRMLEDAMTKLHEGGDENPDFQSVHSYVLNPKSVKIGELYGEYNVLTNEWHDGLASSLLRAAVLDNRPDRHWVVFDGPVDAVWVEDMNTVLDDNCMLCLPNGERIKLNATTMRVLFEVQDLAVASPATVSRCGMVYVPYEDLGWKPFIKSWLQQLGQLHSTHDDDMTEIPQVNQDLVEGLFHRYIDPVLDFIHQHGVETIPSVDINKVASVSFIFQALTHPRHGFSLAEELDDISRGVLNNIFLFSIIWGLGGNLNTSCWDKFDIFIRAQFEEEVPLPMGSNNVFDLCLDDSVNFMISQWEDIVPRFKYNPTLPYFQILVHTIDTVRYSFLLETCLEVNRAVLFNGGSGVGKSAIVHDTLSRLQAEGAAAKDLVDGPRHYMPVVLNFSAQTSSSSTQASFEACLERKRKKLFGAPAGRHIVLFVDDLNMPAREVYGAQPPNELLRQFLDFRGFYDRQKLFWKEIDDVTVCAACGPPGGGRQSVDPRLARQFTMLCLPQPSEMAMRTIFSAILGGFLESHFGADVSHRMLKTMVDSSVDVYLRISQELLPTPTKSHYTFNLRDVSKVFQGVLNIRPAQCPEPRVSLARLWVHENMRVFHDRLTDSDDKEYFMKMLHELLITKFGMREKYENLFVDNTILFGDYMHMGTPLADRKYEEISDLKKLNTLLGACLNDFNSSNKKSPLQLVFFMDAIQHISRIARVIRQPRGSAMLVGVGGSGKQTLTRFACFMSKTECVSIELTRNYGLNEFREQLRSLYMTTGVEKMHVAFLFTDNHIVSESFVEDINSVLNSGEITGLFASDEVERALTKLRDANIDDEDMVNETREGMWLRFINNVRDHLHIVLAMSPVGDAFRSRCRQFPSLINCCTIDWFSAWPADALLSVSSRFLSSQDLGGKEVNSAVSNACVAIHISVIAMSDLFYEELRRRYYISPKSYLDLITLYTTLLSDKRLELGNARDRLLNGLNKLHETNEIVDKMQKELSDLQPILAAKTKDTEQLLEQVGLERKDAEVIRRVVVEEEQEVKLKHAETQHLKDDALKDLEEVLPAMEAAERALSALNKNDIVEIKTFTKPPSLVQLTMEGVCILLQEKPDWETARRVLGENNFVRRLVDYDKDNIPERIMRSIKRVIDDPAFTADQVAKQSKAAMSMCLWVRAMDTYSKVVKVVEPKRNILKVAQHSLDVMNSALVSKQNQLQEVEDKVERLQVMLENTQEELRSLQFHADLSSKRLARAAKLISALGDESVRWKATAVDISERMELLVGDVFLSSACVSYIGAFTGLYRTKLVEGWVATCKDLGIPVSDNFSLQSTLASAVEVREWNIQGLPHDSLSVDNGLLVTRGSRWPLLVDPQDQANRWVKAMESTNGLRSLKVNEPNLLRTLENCIRLGSPVLLEDLGETLDPALDPLLMKNTFFQGPRQLIRLGDSDVEYDPAFKFYMTTKLPNPHYLPEICIKVNIINFTVTIRGLEDQLLGEVVRRERTDLEEARDRLIVSISNDKRQLQDLEDKILKLLRESSGNILDDEVLINTLNNSKVTAGVINARVKEAEETEKKINEAREVYRPVPVRGSLLYFVIADLAAVDPMYQYSLSFFTKLFNDCVDTAAPSSDLPTRLTNLMDFITEFMYKTVCRGLFESHKMIFSFLIYTSIEREAGQLEQNRWDFLLRGGRAPDKPPPTPASLATWLTPSSWMSALAAEKAVPELAQLTAALTKDDKLWETFYLSTDPDLSPMAPLAQSLGLPSGEDELAACGLCPGGMMAMLLVKVLCDDKVMGVVQRYVSNNLGPQFIESPPSNLSDIYQDSTPATPIIFILSQGADPTSALTRFGESMGYRAGGRLHIISLGQGQGPIAEGTLGVAMRSGDWLCLQNCHLAKSWMPRLEHIIEDIQTKYEKSANTMSTTDLSGPPSPSLTKPSSPAGLSRVGTTDTFEADILAARTGLKSPTLAGPGSIGRTQMVDKDAVHPGFRLWLTSMPAKHFPVPVLQNGIKIAMEPPKGLRANMRRTFADMSPNYMSLEGVEDDEDLPDIGAAAAWKKMVFSLAFFHALIQERRKFGALGWNIRYEFSSGDLDCALQTLHMFLLPLAREKVASEAVAKIPWEALLYVTGQINYGGRVTDDNDRRLLTCILKRHYNKSVLLDGHSFTPSGRYSSPRNGNHTDTMTHIDALPYQDEPGAFGLHQNANITFNLQDTRKLFDTVLSIQPRVATSTGAGGKTLDKQVLELAASIQDGLPAPLLRANASVIRDPFAPLPSGHDNSLGTVLTQEISRFNVLLAVLNRSLTELQHAIQGLVVMSPELEAMSLAMNNNQVPELWKPAAYPSLKSLGSWVQDFKQRMAVMRSWLEDGEPTTFWLPGFFFPQGFMTGALQNHARKTMTPIDRLSFGFRVLEAEAGEDAASGGAGAGRASSGGAGAGHSGSGGAGGEGMIGGVVVGGLYLESAAWDQEKKCLQAARPRQMASPLPPIHFVPIENYTPPQEEYQCPLYKTSVRAGVLSTTGQSTNFVLHISLPCAAGSDADFWIMQGVAALCAPDNS